MYRLGSSCRRYVMSSALGCNTCQALNGRGSQSVWAYSILSRNFADEKKSKVKKPAAKSMESKKKKGGRDESKAENEALYNFMHAAEDAKRWASYYMSFVSLLYLY
jgi:hypothetical protein